MGAQQGKQLFFFFFLLSFAKPRLPLLKPFFLFQTFRMLLNAHRVVKILFLEAKVSLPKSLHNIWSIMVFPIFNAFWPILYKVFFSNKIIVKNKQKEKNILNLFLFCDLRFAFLFSTELSVAQEDLEIDPMKIRVPEQEKAAKIEQNCAVCFSFFFSWLSSFF